MALKVPPLGGGFLTGTIDTLGADNFRNNNPRYQGDNFAANKQRFAPLMKLAEELGITAAQLSLAWLLHQGEDIIPIPGTRSQKRVTENARAVDRFGHLSFWKNIYSSTNSNSFERLKRFDSGKSYF